ncbi:hypothetical protein HYW83_02405 [Candidatus Peregrinibacteria bacterium]|nr:hypothetical protein [Candidatus Peregrinibacteria bacterium]
MDPSLGKAIGEALERFSSDDRYTLVEGGIYRRVEEELLPTHRDNFRLLGEIEARGAKDVGEAETVKDMYAIVSKEIRRQASSMGIFVK